LIAPKQEAGVAAAFRRSMNMAAPLQEASMITAYHSTVLDHPVDRVWSLIRDFNNYPAYIDGVTASVIEDGKRRRGRRGAPLQIRRQLDPPAPERPFRRAAIAELRRDGAVRLAGQMDDPPSPIRYEGTIHLLPIVDDNRTFIEWPVTLHAAPDEEEPWQRLFLSWIPEWTESLRRALARQ
jgi:hypothetical protein